MEAVILLGAPGAGKGTVADELTGACGLVHLSTGDMLREAVKNAHPIGIKAKSYMEKGELVPDDVILGLVSDRLDRGEPGTRYLFDGFPRTLPQAEMLDAVLRDRKGRVAGVFLLDVPREILVSRLAGRRVCRGCGAVYHVKNIPPKVEGVCDRCGGALYQRPDDNEATVANRLDVYERQTSTLIDYYRQRGVLTAVDGVDKQRCVDGICEALPGPAS